MLEYNRIDILEGIDINKTSSSKECDICHYWYFKDIDFKYEPYVCNGCHDLTPHFCHVSKDDTVSIMKNYNLIDKKGVL